MEVKKVLIVLTGDPPTRFLGNKRKRTFEWLVSSAAKEEENLYLVTPEDVTVRHEQPVRMMAWRHTAEFPGNAWRRERVKIAFPVWIDLMYLRDLQRHAYHYARLRTAIKKSGRPLLNPVLPGKDFVYHVLSTNKTTASYVPKTKQVKSVADVRAFLKQMRIGWLKPVFGSGGRNIVRIEQLDEHDYLIQSDTLGNKRIMCSLSAPELNRLIRKQVKQRAYVIQEEVPLPQLSDGRRLDVRVTVQQSHQGDWQVTATTLRCSRKGGVVTNYHAGGLSSSISTQQAKQWLREAHVDHDALKRCHTAALHTARALEQTHPNLAFLGIDVAPTANGCYVYDCNSRPGRDILTNQEVRTMMQRLVGFATYVSMANAKASPRD